MMKRKSTTEMLEERDQRNIAQCCDLFKSLRRQHSVDESLQRVIGVRKVPKRDLILWLKDAELLDMEVSNTEDTRVKSHYDTEQESEEVSKKQQLHNAWDGLYSQIRRKKSEEESIQFVAQANNVSEEEIRSVLQERGRIEKVEKEKVQVIEEIPPVEAEKIAVIEDKEKPSIKSLQIFKEETQLEITEKQQLENGWKLHPNGTHIFNPEGRIFIRKGISVNSAGRGKGNLSLIGQLRRKLEEINSVTGEPAYKELIDTIIDSAKAGDVRCQQLIFAYLEGMPRKIGENGGDGEQVVVTRKVYVREQLTN